MHSLSARGGGGGDKRKPFPFPFQVVCLKSQPTGVSVIETGTSTGAKNWSEDPHFAQKWWRKSKTVSHLGSQSLLVEVEVEQINKEMGKRERGPLVNWIRGQREAIKTMEWLKVRNYCDIIIFIKKYKFYRVITLSSYMPPTHPSLVGM